MNKKHLLRNLLCIICLILLLPFIFLSQISTNASESILFDNDIINMRTEHSKTYSLGKNKFAIDSYIDTIHYKDNYSDLSEVWKDIDLSIVNNQIIKAPYILTIDNVKLSYNIIDKKTGDSLTICGIGKLEPFNTGFRLVRQIDDATELWKLNAEFSITQKGTSISVNSRAFDATGKELYVNSKIENNVLSENISSKELIDIVYPIIIDPTIDIQANASLDDLRMELSNTTLDSEAVLCNLGDYDGSGNKGYGAAVRFPLSIPQGSVIDTANITLQARNSRSGTTCNARIVAESSVNASAYSDVWGTEYARYQNHTLASVDWDSIQAWTDDVWYSTPEIKTIIQEITDNVSWESGNYIGFYIQDFDYRSSTAAYRQFSTYDDSPSAAPVIHVEYTSGGNPPSVTTLESTLVEETTVRFNSEITATGGANSTSIGWDYGLNPYVDHQAIDYPVNYGIGTYYYNETSLQEGSYYKFRFWAYNPYGTTYGDYLYFMTKPNACSSVSVNATAENSISFDVEAGNGQDYVEIRYSDSDYPSDNVSGTLGYWGSVGTANVTGLNCNTLYYFSFFSIAEDDGMYSISSTKLTSNDSTGSCPPTNVPDPPANFAVYTGDSGEIYCAWGNDDSANISATIIIGGFTYYPTDNNTGFLIYSGLTEEIDISQWCSSVQEIYLTAYSYNNYGASDNSYAYFGGTKMNMNISTLILIFFSLGLLMVNFFRFNILIVLAAIFVNIALAQQPNTPLFVIYAAWFLAFAEGMTGFVRLVFGKKNKKRYVG